MCIAPFVQQNDEGALLDGKRPFEKTIGALDRKMPRLTLAVFFFTM